MAARLVTCIHCGKTFPLPDGWAVGARITKSLGGGATVVLTCPHCHKKVTVEVPR